MSLAEVEDVRRVLRIPSSDVNEERDTQLSAALEAAESWVRSRLNQDWDADLGGTQIAYDVRETDDILLDHEGCSVTEVRVTLDDSSAFLASDSLVLSASQYDLISGRYGARTLRLRPSLVTQPFEGAIATRLPRTYRTVEIDWEPSLNSVPAAVRDATALLAAGFWKSNPRLASGYTSERMGDYSYLVQPPSGGKGGAPSDYWEQAYRMLRPFTRRKPRVT